MAYVWAPMEVRTDEGTVSPGIEAIMSCLV